MNREYTRKATIILLVFLISAIFLGMIHHFLMPIFLAGIFAALVQPLYQSLKRWFGGRRNLASLVTILFVVFIILVPLGVMVGIITSQAIEVGKAVRPWVQQKLSEPDMLSEMLKSLPFYGQIEPYRNLILQKAGEMVGGLSHYLINSLSSITMMTVNFLFATVILLYAMFFFLMDGDKLLAKILYYLPLEDKDEQLLLGKFTSITRAILKGTIVVGIVQGTLAGIAFWIAGIPNAIFWGAIMAALSIVPNIGSALVWLPASLILLAGGNYVQGLGLAVFCGLVVGGVDNFLRPILVGKDTKIHELMIFLSTLGGLALFGFIGIIVGPVIATLFITIWEIYGVAFKEVLPPVDRGKRSSVEHHEEAESHAQAGKTGIVAIPAGTEDCPADKEAQVIPTQEIDSSP